MKNPSYLFIAKVLIFPFLFLITFILIFIHPTSFIYAKHDRLAFIQEPKLVFTGGSNAIYGIDSEMIEKSIHMPVVDYAVRAGTPVSFYINEISPFVKNGDIIVFVLEYSYYSGLMDDTSISRIIGTYPQGILHLPIKCIPKIPKYIPIVFQSGYAKLLKGTILDIPVNTYNKWGDELGLLYYHQDLVEDPEMSKFFPLEHISKSTISELNRFNEFAAKKGAKVIIMYPSMYKKTYLLGTKNVIDLDKYLRSHINFPILGTPERFTFEREYISNTVYHLNIKGRKIRTDLMIEDLQKSGLINPK
jgi:hypothetical protein